MKSFLVSIPFPIPSHEKILVILPAYNEKWKIGNLLSKILQENLVHGIVVVDDASTDGTFEEVKSFGSPVTVLRHAKNMGVGAAIRTGIDHGRENGYTIAVIMGGDDQDNPSEMRRVLFPILYDDFEFVQGSRYMSGGKIEEMTRFRLLTTALYSWTITKLLNYPVSDGTNGYRAFRLSILDHPDIQLHQDWLNRYELETYFSYKVIELKMRTTEVPVTKRYPKDRRIGYTKMIPFISWWEILKPLFYLKLGLRK